MSHDANANADRHKKQQEMEQLINFLSELNLDNPTDYAGDLNELCTRNVGRINIATQDVAAFEDLPSIENLNSNDDSIRWKYIILNFQLMCCIKHVLKDTNSWVLSVQHRKTLKNVFRNIIGVGLASNLRPNLPYYTKLPSDAETPEVISDFLRHKQLVATTQGILLCTKFPPFRSIIIEEFLKYVLSAFYQIIYCPFKKPNGEADSSSAFIMTEDIYNRLLRDRETFKRSFTNFSTSLHTTLYVRETMMLFNKSSPNWMKRAVSSTLSELIRSPKGLETISYAMLDAAGLEDANDSTKSWQILDVIAKIVMDSRKLPDFRENISKQLRDLLKSRTKTGEPVKSFERLFTLCTKLLYQEDESLCQEVFISHILEPLICFTNEGQCLVCNEENVTDSVRQIMFLLRSLIVDSTYDLPSLPVKITIPVLNVIFRIELVVIDCTSLKDLHDDIKSVLVKALEKFDLDFKFSVFDSFLFEFPQDEILNLRNNLEFCVEDDLLKLKKNEHVVLFGPLIRMEVLKRLVKENSQLTSIFFPYLLNCVVDREKYHGEIATNKDLLGLENEIVLDEIAGRDMAIYKALSELIEDKNIQSRINEEPADIIRYIEKVLENAISTGLHKSEEFESDHFHTLFLVVMILHTLSENFSPRNCERYKRLTLPLNIIKEESNNAELKELSEKIIKKLTQKTKEEFMTSASSEKNELEKALDDICDPLLPVRGHGLMILTKLIEKRDKNAIERKQFILNIFQQNLKNEDSYIYLNAIGGLAAMGDIFPDTVLKVLADEYSDFTRKDSTDGHELRMKLGEVLVRIIRLLGEMAPKYKSLLLNTFLVGAKDEDHLIRASSLSNLGEVCKVLGYKLGSIVTEVLVCVHAVISTDKAAEARRAAVTVARQLFVGLEKEMIVFLKDDILPLYRTLKHIYYHDSDDVMKLQAQLALEQLNENMKDFVLPNVQLHNDKKIILLD